MSRKKFQLASLKRLKKSNLQQSQMKTLKRPSMRNCFNKIREIMLLN